jgi:hypothetical protein
MTVINEETVVYDDAGLENYNDLVDIINDDIIATWKENFVPFSYVSILKSYKENRPKNVKKLLDGTKLKEFIINSLLANYEQYEDNVNNKYSMFEIITGRVKIFFDIEKIPQENDNMIDEIINDIRKFVKETANIDLMNYGLTLNRGSCNHEGLSYHLVFTEYSIDVRKLKKLVTAFINTEEYSKYKDVIDAGIYNLRRLFKLPYQYGVQRENESKSLNDYHEVVHGTLIDMFITQVGNTRPFAFEYVGGKGGNEISGGQPPSNLVKTVKSLINKLDDRFGKDEDAPKTISDNKIIDMTMDLLTILSPESIHVKFCNEIIEHFNKNNSLKTFRLTEQACAHILEMITEKNKK